MRLHIPRCLECHRPAVGSSDLIPAVALFSTDPTEGDVEFEGETRLSWEFQYNNLTDVEIARAPDLTPLPSSEWEYMKVTCADGHEWITPVLF